MHHWKVSNFYKHNIICISNDVTGLQGVFLKSLMKAELSLSAVWVGATPTPLWQYVQKWRASSGLMKNKELDPQRPRPAEMCMS